jgi:hypothetical protein
MPKTIFQEELLVFFAKIRPPAKFNASTYTSAKGFFMDWLIPGRNDVPRFNKCYLYRNLLDGLKRKER